MRVTAQFYALNFQMFVSDFDIRISGFGVAMEPMYLPDIENHPAVGPYGERIAAARAQGMPIPQIWHLFAFAPEATKHLDQFTQEIMREPAPLTPGFRELIAAYTSYRNNCPF